MVGRGYLTTRQKERGREREREKQKRWCENGTIGVVGKQKIGRQDPVTAATATSESATWMLDFGEVLGAEHARIANHQDCKPGASALLRR